MLAGRKGDLAEKRDAEEAAALMRLAQGASTILNEADGDQSAALQVSSHRALTHVLTSDEKLSRCICLLLNSCGRLWTPGISGDMRCVVQRKPNGLMLN